MLKRVFAHFKPDKRLGILKQSEYGSIEQTVLGYQYGFVSFIYDCMNRFCCNKILQDKYTNITKIFPFRTAHLRSVFP